VRKIIALMLEDANVEDSPAAEAPVPQVDVSRPHPARMYDYYLGGCFP
jgi:hypothetical protein